MIYTCERCAHSFESRSSDESLPFLCVPCWREDKAERKAWGDLEARAEAAETRAKVLEEALENIQGALCTPDTDEVRCLAADRIAYEALQAVADKDG